MSDMYLIVSLAGRRLAIPAGEVHSVIEIDPGDIQQVPGAPDHVAGLAALRSRVMTVVDPRRAIGLPPTEDAAAVSSAVVIERDAFLYAMLMERHEDLMEARSDIQSLNGSAGRGWEDVSKGLIDTDGGTAMVVDIARIIDGRRARATMANESLAKLVA